MIFYRAIFFIFLVVLLLQENNFLTASARTISVNKRETSPRRAVRTVAQQKAARKNKKNQYLEKQKVVLAEKNKIQEQKNLLKKSPKTMSLEELYAAKDYATQSKLYDNVAEIVQRLIIKHSENQDQENQYQEKQRILRLELADVHFDKGDFKQASKFYQEYVSLYPGSKPKELDYVKYKEILCRFYMCLKASCDQTKTRKTLSLVASYLEKETPHKEYYNEVKKIQHTCYETLFVHEAEILVFYSRQGQKSDARLRDLKKEFEPVIAQFEPRIIDLEISLAQHEGNAELVAQKQQELTDKFPLHTATIAQNKAKRSNADRF